ncbi:hypothetical protein [Polaromonas sp. YR568]|uniref:hypothetical protein n=1 Tax=Polaromonas sp. YR568 TaxID=1855301 RepID=UPI00313824A3
MKTLIPLIVYALLSGLIGLLACSWLLWRSRRSYAALAAAFFFGGPMALYGFLQTEAALAKTSYEEDVAYVKELCAKYGGDKIYKTVDNVEGIFQMKARNPDQDKQWADQYGMEEPWALAFGDRGSSPSDLGIRGKGYWFIEQQPGYGLNEGPPYRRRFLIGTTTKIQNSDPDAVVSSEGFVLERTEAKVQKLKSRYGYVTEDLSTPELRKRWIGGGKLKIIDLNTHEILAERTDYYRATGSQVKMAWVDGVSCRRDKLTYIPSFIRSVLRPPIALPTEQQLAKIKGE